MGEILYGIYSAGAALFAASGVTGFIARLGATILLSSITSKLFGPKVPDGIGLTSHQVTTDGSLEYRKLVYGKALVSGPRVFRGTAGTDKQELWTVIALCQGESESIESVWLDGEEIPAADISWTPGVGSNPGSGSGAVSTAAWIGENSAAGVYCFWATGHANQSAIAALVAAFPELDSTFRLRGITYLVVKLINNVDTGKLWEKGVPQNISALVKGRKVYDVRLDSTNGGTGAHRKDDPTTWEWSENPAAHVADYLMTQMDVAP